jgi:hypothetical protein
VKFAGNTDLDGNAELDDAQKVTLHELHGAGRQRAEGSGGAGATILKINFIVNLFENINIATGTGGA